MKKIFIFAFAPALLILLIAAGTQQSGPVTTSRVVRSLLTNETIDGIRTALGVGTNAENYDLAAGSNLPLAGLSLSARQSISNIASAAATDATNSIVIRGAQAGANITLATNGSDLVVNSFGEDAFDENDIGFIRGMAKQVITKNRFTFTDGTYGHNPGTDYGQMWIRDWTLARDGMLNAISLDESESVITTWSNQFFASRAFPDFIDNTKASLFDGFSTSGGKILPSLDVPFDFMHAIYQDYLQRGNAMMFSNNWVVASNAMNFLGWSNNAYVPLPGIAIKNGLVYSTNTTCINAGSVGIVNYGSFGFHDAIPKRGYDLWLSLVRYRALKEAAELAAVVGQRTISSNLLYQADVCTTNLVTYLWSASDGWFLSATETNSIPDPLGSAYAVWLRAVDASKVAIIASNAAACSPGGPLFATKFCITNGAVMIPGYGNYWDWAPFAAAGAGQNGTAWQGFAGIWNYAVGLYSPQQARNNWRDFVAFTRSSTNQPFLEFFGPTGAQVRGSWSYMQGAQALQYFNRIGSRSGVAVEQSIRGIAAGTGMTISTNNGLLTLNSSAGGIDTSALSAGTNTFNGAGTVSNANVAVVASSVVAAVTNQWNLDLSNKVPNVVLSTLANSNLPALNVNSISANSLSADSISANGSGISNTPISRVVLASLARENTEYGTNISGAVAASAPGDEILIVGTINLYTNPIVLPRNVSIRGFNGGRLLYSGYGPAIVIGTNQVVSDLTVESDYLPLQNLMVETGDGSINQGIGIPAVAAAGLVGLPTYLGCSNVLVQNCTFISQADCVAFGTNYVVKTYFVDCKFNYYWDGYVDQFEEPITNDFSFVNCTWTWLPLTYTNDAGQYQGGVGGSPLKNPPYGAKVIGGAFYNNAPVSGFTDGGKVEIYGSAVVNQPTASPFNFNPDEILSGMLVVNGTNWTKLSQVFLGTVQGLNTTYSVTAAGTAATVASFGSGAGGILNFGTTDPVLYITNAGSYLITSFVNITHSTGATIDELGEGITARILVAYKDTTELLGSPGLLALGWANGDSLSAWSATSHDSLTVVIPPFVLTTPTNNAVIELRQLLNEDPSSGTVTATDAQIIAIKINP